MQWLTQAYSTDSSRELARSKGNQNEISKCESAWQKQLVGFAMVLSGFSKSTLPAIIQHDQQLSQIRKNDEPTLLKAVITLIGLTADNLQVPRMSAVQMVDAARSILKEFYYFRIEEVAYALDQGRKGKYGKIYNRIDLEIISQWLTAYDTGERLHFCELIRKQERESEDNGQSIQDAYQRLAEGGKSFPQMMSEKDRERKTNASLQERDFQVWKANYLEQKRAERAAKQADAEPETD